MKKIVLLIFAMAISILLLHAQNDGFKEFVSYFPDKSLPYVKNNFSSDKSNNIPATFALRYLCNGDSSLLVFENVGINQETHEVVYRNIEPYQYKAYANFEVDYFYLLIYDDYLKDGYHEFTSVINVGLFSEEGTLLDEMPFYIFDDRGKLKEQTSQITLNYELQIIQKEYIKNEKGRFTSSYNEITTTYIVDKSCGKFKEVSKDKVLINNTKK